MVFSAHTAHLLSWGIASASALGVITRPFRWPEAVWAVGGAAMLVVLGLLPGGKALEAVGKGTDVYLFLIGMMLLSETARREGLFDWIASIAVAHSNRSPRKLFFLVYVVGVVVTTFMSNDATAVVMTPAVCMAARKARVEPLPYLFICAFVANAASFVLPISNPANIVLYGDHTPALGAWLAAFAVPAALAIAATYAALWFTEARRLPATCASEVDVPVLSTEARIAMAGLGLTAAVLTGVSALDMPLGLPTAAMGVLTTLAVLVKGRSSPWPTLKGISWAVLPLVAGLFVLVQSLIETGVIAMLAQALTRAVADGPVAAAAGAGIVVALASNLINNLPAGLIASSTLQLAQPPREVVDALLIGVDLGPNISVTGSLATILWLTAIRREGEEVGFWRFLRLGVLVTTPALLLALAARLLVVA